MAIAEWFIALCREALGISITMQAWGCMEDALGLAWVQHIYMGPLEVTATYRQPTKDDRTSEVNPLFIGSLTTPHYPPRFLPYTRLFEDN